MNLDDLREQLREAFENLWINIRESSLFNTLVEKYQTLPSVAQKSIILGVLAIFVVFMLSIPLSFFTSSSDYISNFEDNKDLIRKLNQTKVSLDLAPNIPRNVPSNVMKGKVAELISKQGLNQDQIEEPKISSYTPAQKDIKFEASLVSVTLKNLNVKQIFKIGEDLSRIDPTAQMSGMTVTASRENENYFDVNFRIVNYQFPQLVIPEVSAPEVKGSKDSKSNSRSSRRRSRRGN